MTQVSNFMKVSCKEFYFSNERILSQSSIIGEQEDCGLYLVTHQNVTLESNRWACATCGLRKHVFTQSTWWKKNFVNVHCSDDSSTLSWCVLMRNPYFFYKLEELLFFFILICGFLKTCWLIASLIIEWCFVLLLICRLELGYLELIH